MKTTTSIFKPKCAGFCLIALFTLSSSLFTVCEAQVGINPNGTAPDINAILDLNTGTNNNLGLIVPNVSLTALTTFDPPMANAATAGDVGMMVYNTNAAVGSGVGYYYWTGTTWANLGSSVSGSGIVNYVARWTSATNLGTGVIQDNGYKVGISYPPAAGYKLIDTCMTYNAFGAQAYGAGGIAGVFLGVGTGGYGVKAEATDIGVYAYADSIGVYAEADTALTAYGTFDGIKAYGTGHWGVYAKGVGGEYGYGQDVGVEGEDTMGDEGILANNGGYGVIGDGVTYGVYALATDASGTGAGVYGEDDNAMGVYGYSEGTYPTGAGVYGECDGGGFGVWGVDNTIAIVGVDGDANTDGGEGVQGRATTLNSYPLVGYNNYGTAQTDYPIIAGDCGYSGAIVDVDYYDGTTQWKVTGTGSAGTVVKDVTGTKVRLTCPETPEILFEDYGEGQLINGKAHVDLDPTIAKNVTINEKHPLKAFVQLEGDCNGVYVANKSASGFDVIELNHGTSNVSFSWHIVANRADETMEHGVVSHNADIRFAKVDLKVEQVIKANMDKQMAAVPKTSLMKKRTDGIDHSRKPIGKRTILSVNAQNTKGAGHVTPLKIIPLTSPQSQPQGKN